MRHQKLAGLLMMMLLLVETQSKISLSVSSSLSKISSTLSSFGRNVQTRVTKITDALNSEQGQETLDAVSNSIDQIGGAVGSVTSSDVLNIVSGSMEMISAITALIPKYGQVVSLVFGLVGTILGAIGGSDDVGTIVKREIEKALNTYDDTNLRAEAEGTMRVYRVSQAYLNSVETDEPINEHEVAALAANVPINSGVKFLGVLASKINHYSSLTDVTSVQRAAEYVRLYVTLAIMRTSILWEMYSLVREADNSEWTANAIKRTVEAEQQNDATFMNFLTAPVYSKATFFTYYKPSDWPAVKSFLAKTGKSFQDLSFLSQTARNLRPESWQSMYMRMENNAWGQIAGTGSLFDESMFYFDIISAENNIFFIRSKRWPSWYVIMDSTWNCRGWGAAPGYNGQWKITRFEDGKYMLSPLDNPTGYMHMTSTATGLVRGYGGDPGQAGHWIIA